MPPGEVALPAPPLGALGVPVEVPAAPIWETAAFGGGERIVAKKNIKNLGRHERPIFGAPGPPRSGRQLTPPSAAIKKDKKIWGAEGSLARIL